MGRKSNEYESILETSKRRAAETEENEKKKNSQYDDLNRFVPVYELNEMIADETAAEERQQERKSKMPPLRNDGQSSRGFRLSELKREAVTLDTAKNQKHALKKSQRDEQKRRYESLQGAEVLGNGHPKIKRPRSEINGKINGFSLSENSTDKSTNGIEQRSPQKKKKNRVIDESSDEEEVEERLNDADNSNTFIELDQLKPGPVGQQIIEYDKEVRTEHIEEVTKCIVQTPSDQEEVSEIVEQDDDEFARLPRFWRVVYTSDSNKDEEEEEVSDESFGIDLDESEGLDDEEEIEDFNSEDEKFIADDNEELEIQKSPDVAIYENHGRGAPRRSRPTTFKNVRIDDSDSSDSDDMDYTSSERSEDEQTAEPLIISASEINDLLEDLSEESEDDTVVDSSDEERYNLLDPRALDVKPIGLSIDGYFVNEETRKFIEIHRDSEIEYSTKRYELFCFSEPTEHSVNSASKALKWLISPFGVQDFFEHIYAERGLLIHRSDSKYYGKFFPVSAFYRMFQNHTLDYGTNINVANYENGIRTTHNPIGRAYAGAVRSFIDSGFSIQCVNPQSFNSNIHYICDILQELFGCFVGANCYYTPKQSAGFAPHYDDIDAFMIQTQGRKHWTIYAPTSDEQWPIESSGNFTQEEMVERDDQIVFSGWLETGDVLYIPRGFIHVAKTDNLHDSLHVTISVAQKHSMSDLVQTVTNKMLQAKLEAIPQLRRNLPIDILSICGVADVQYESEERFLKTLERPIATYLNQFLIGLNFVLPAAVDDLAKSFMRKALPPLLTDYEKEHSIHGLEGQDFNIPVFKRKTQVRIIRKHTQRLLFETETKAYLIHRMDNSTVYEGKPEVIVDVPEAFVSPIELLLRHYPEWDEIEELGSDYKISKAAVQFLYEKGILLVRSSKSKGAKKKRKPKMKKPVELEVMQEDDVFLELENLNDQLMEIMHSEKQKKKKKLKRTKKETKIEEIEKPKKKVKKLKKKKNTHD